MRAPAALRRYDRDVALAGGKEGAVPDATAPFRMLGWRWRLVVTGLLLVLVSTLAVSVVRDPVYRGTVDVLLRERAAGTLDDPGSPSGPDDERRIETEIEVVRSAPVRADVRRRLGGDVPRPRVGQVGSSDILRISAASRERARASALAGAYADAYIEFRRARTVEDLEGATRRLQARIDELQREIDALASSGSPSGSRDLLVTQLAVYRQRLGDLRLEADLESGAAQVVTRGAPPATKTGLTPWRSGILALLGGLSLGVLLAWLRERFDQSVKTKEDVERVLAGVPTLALIPVADSWRNRSEAVLVSVSAPESPSAEAYRCLRTSLQFIGVERVPRVIQISSSNAGEGKTSTLCNLGVAFARAGKRVVLVDGDLRRSRMHEFFGLGNEVGFTSTFVGDSTIEDAVRPVPDVDGLFLLASGPVPPDPSELLASRRTAEILLDLSDTFDLVLVDSPPVLPVTDAMVLSGWVDATALLIAPGVTSRRELERALELLRQVEAPLVGAVVNQTTRTSGYSMSYYRYGYEPQETGLRGRLARRGGRRGPSRGAPPSRPPLPPPAGGPPTSTDEGAPHARLP